MNKNLIELEKYYDKMTIYNHPKLDWATNIRNGLTDQIAQTKRDYKFSVMLESEFKRDNWKVTKKKGTTLSTCRIPGTNDVTIKVEEEL